MITAHKPYPAGDYRILSSTETSTADDLDLIAVERVLNNSVPLPALTEAEQRLAVKLLTETDVPAHEIVARTGVRLAVVAAWMAGPAPRRRREPPTCPSRAAYHRHRARGETCEPCKKANAEADRRYRLTGSTKARSAA